MKQKKMEEALKAKMKHMQKISFLYSNQDDFPHHLRECFKKNAVTNKKKLLAAIEYMIDKLPDHLNCFISLEFYSKRLKKVKI